MLPVASNSQKSSAKIGGSNNIPTNSLSSTKQNVNRKPLQKYSMQETEKNTQNTIKINSDGEVKYFENKNTEQPIFHLKV